MTCGTGSPVTVTNTFTLLNPNTQYTLKAFNGGLQNDTSKLVAQSTVSLNNIQVIGATNFNQSVTTVSVPISAGFTSTTSVHVVGKPGCLLTIQVIGVDNADPDFEGGATQKESFVGAGRVGRRGKSLHENIQTEIDHLDSNQAVKMGFGTRRAGAQAVQGRRSQDEGFTTS